MAMYGTKPKAVEGIHIEPIKPQITDEIFKQRKKLFQSIFCIFDMGFRNLAKPKRHKRVSVEIKAKEAAAETSQSVKKQFLVAHYQHSIFTENQEALARFTFRLEQLFNHELSLVDNPLHPSHLIRHFKVAVHTISAGETEQLGLLAVLLEVLESEYKELLIQANQGFSSNRLPEIIEDEVYLRYAEEVAQADMQHRRNQSFLNSQSGLQPTDIYKSQKAANLIERLAESISSPLISRQHSTLPKIKSTELLEELALLNPLPVFMPPSDEQAAMPETETAIALIKQVKMVLEEKQACLEPQVESILTLVSRLLEVMEEDINLHPRMMAILRHFRIPLARVAVNNPLFLFDTENPLEVLIDRTAGAATKWLPNPKNYRDSLYNKLASIMERINRDFYDNYKVIEDCTDDLELFMRAEKRRYQLLEENLLEQFRKQDHYQKIEHDIDRHMEMRFSSEQLPGAFQDFVHQTWRSVVAYCFLQGETSEEAISTKQLESHEKLLLAPFQGRKLHNSAPLLNATQLLLQKTGLPPEQVRVSINNLKSALAEANTDSSHYSQGGLYGAELPTMEELDSEELETYFSTSGPSKKDEYDLQVEQLTSNCWVEMNWQGTVSRCRLATRLPFSDTLIFVDRGASAGAHRRKDLAALLREGELQLRILDTEGFVQRTLEATINI